MTIWKRATDWRGAGQTGTGILENAGAKDVMERQLNFEIKASISIDQFWQLRTEMSGTLREKMAGVAPAQLPTIKQAVADAARRYFGSGTMSFPAEALIVSGGKSSYSELLRKRKKQAR